MDENKTRNAALAALDDVFAALMIVILNMGLENYGEIPQETAERIAEEIGNAVDFIVAVAQEGAYDDVSVLDDNPDQGTLF